jgi:two-component system sensor histidine kinase DesK
MLVVPTELKITYFILFGITILLVGFVLFILMIYSKKQQLLLKEKQLNDAKLQNQKLEIELAIQKSLQSERDRISGDMHDELGAGISAIKLQSEILKQQIDKNKLQQEDINEIIRISDDMNNAMREMLWSLNSKNDLLINFAAHCQLYIENYLSKAQIETVFTIEIAKENNYKLSSENRRTLMMVIKEACHNIIKHSQATKVIIKMETNKQLLLISILDNGVGFDQTIQNDGYGLSTMQSRISGIGGRFLISPNSNGTLIEISIPM